MEWRTVYPLGWEDRRKYWNRCSCHSQQLQGEQQGYKSCMGLLKLADKYSPERLESACKRALEYTPRPPSRISGQFWHPGRIKLPRSRRKPLLPPHGMDSPVGLNTTEGGTRDADRNNGIQAAGNALKRHGQCVKRPACGRTVPEYGL